MALHITPAMIEAAYELVRTTPPFSRWKLPEGDAVVFRVIASWHCGSFNVEAGIPVISVSARRCSRLASLVEIVAHEMIHMREDQLGCRWDVQHGREFKRLARRVCNKHGFEESLF